MNYVERQLHLAKVEQAARMPRVADGESLEPPKWRLQERKDGNVRLYKDGAYWGTLGVKTLADAQAKLELMLLQEEADEDGVLDVRRVMVSTIIARRKDQVVDEKLAGAKTISSTLGALEQRVAGLQLRRLSDVKIKEIGAAMVAEGYAYEYFVNAARYLATAIRKYTRKEHGAIYLPYDPPRRPKGRQIVVSQAQRDRVKALYETALDPAGGMTEKQRRDAQLAYMEFYLGLVFGSRPGAYAKLAWEQHGQGGWLDLDGAVFHRVPPGAETPGNKRADPVDIPAEVLPELRRWKQAARGSKWVFRTLKGDKPLGQREQQKIFKAQMLALGLEKVTGHVMRHSFITWALLAGADPLAVAAVASVSIETMFRRYAHLIRRRMQKRAHGVMATLMAA
ncbi:MULTISPECIES: tyrosine-type recombinase/integrase [unclassified Bradyrhizobium]|uniref:tyrosine-type recombinase/integrase n=1 Tax=unclassified Bradyrhizobium TaxID=2631580 RepID=UPI0033924293